MTYELVLFDLGGTLIDTNFVQLLSLKKLLLERFERSYKIKDLEYTLGLPASKALNMLDIKDAESANVVWNEYMMEFSSQINLFSEIKDTVECIHKNGLNMGIVTSSTRDEFENYFLPLGISSHFKHVVCAEDTEFHKPFPHPILKILEKFGTESSKSIYIGDSMHDYQCAENANVSFGAAMWGKNECMHENAVKGYKFFRPTDLIDFLELNL